MALKSHFSYFASKTKANLKTFVRNSFVLLNVVAVAALLLAYASCYVSPVRWWWLPFLGLAYPFILGGNILFVLFWILLRRRVFLLSLVTILMGWGYVTRFVQLKGQETGEEGIKVLSYNVRHFSGAGLGGEKPSAAQIIAFLDRQNADIICLQESRLRKNNIFNLSKTVKELDEVQHYQFASSSQSYGSVTMTRYPIVNMGEIRFENSRNITIFTDMLIGGDTVRVYNVHLQSYRINPKEYDALESIDLQEEKNIEVKKKVLVQMRKAFRMRAGQVETIRQHMDACHYAIIVCGDFNDTPASYAYCTLQRNMIDAFVNSGRGVGRTYVGKLPSFRIDYILHSKHFESYNFETIDFFRSDHLPVSCTLILRN